MVKKLNLNPYLLSIPIILSLLAYVVYQRINSTVFPPELSIAITIDMLLTIPVLYFLAIRKNDKIPNISVVSVFIICMVIAGLILPVDQQTLLGDIKIWAFPIAELCIVAYIIIKVRGVVNEYKIKGENDLDFFDAITLSVEKVFPGKIAGVFITEIAVVYYCFFSKSKQLSDNHFTFFKRSGIKATVIAFIGIVLTETIVVHLLVYKYSVTLSWVLSFISLYTCIQIVALVRSMNVRMPVIDLDNNLVILRYGFFSQTQFPISDIKEIFKSTKTLPDDKSIVQFSPLGILDSHNIVIHLNNEYVLTQLYGRQKRFKSIAIYIDEKDEFINTIKTNM